MKYLAIILLLTTMESRAQEQRTITYNYGHSGIELISRCGKGTTVIVSTYNAKMNIREEIAQKVFQLFEANKIQPNDKLTIECNDAKVSGKCIIRNKNKLTAVDFYFEKILWNNGTTEIYVKPAQP